MSLHTCVARVVLPIPAAPNMHSPCS
uniref:Uncharacterized protein n=1 Tax=Arundo donax TaxID=35708 RepID=A0A0A9B1N2_ARUDO